MDASGRCSNSRALVLAALFVTGCVEELDPLTGTSSLRVELDSPTATGTEDDRLDDAALPDRGCKPAEVAFGEFPTRVSRVRAQELDRHLAGAARALDDRSLVDVADQGGKAAPEAELGCFLGHRGPLLSLAASGRL